MKTHFTLLTVLVLTLNMLFKPIELGKKNTNKTEIHFDGLYVSKTGEVNIPNNKMDIYTYIRFYEDGTVYTQAVNSYAPEQVIKWFGKNGRFERKGEFKIDGTDLTFTVNNSESSDKALEGAKSDQYNGKITAQNQLTLEVEYDNGTLKSFQFEFIKLN